MSRRLKEVRRCVECLRDFRPSHKPQRTCSIHCGAARRVRLHPRTGDMGAAIAERKRQYRQRLETKLKEMAPYDIWRLAYNRGYNMALMRMRRGKAA